MKSVEQRIMARVVIEDTHWIWTGAWSKPITEKRWQREQAHVWALNLPRDPDRHTAYQRNVSRPLIKLNGRNQNVRRILLKCDDPNQRVYPACFEPRCVNPEHTRLTLCINTRTGERPKPPGVDENVQYIIDTFPTNPEEALTYGATAVQVAAARGVLRSRGLPN